MIQVFCDKCKKEIEDAFFASMGEFDPNDYPDPRVEYEEWTLCGDCYDLVHDFISTMYNWKEK